MKEYVVTFSAIILPNACRCLAVFAVDAEDAQERAIDTLEEKGICLPSILSIRKA